MNFIDHDIRNTFVLQIWENNMVILPLISNFVSSDGISYIIVTFTIFQGN